MRAPGLTSAMPFVPPSSRVRRAWLRTMHHQQIRAMRPSKVRLAARSRSRPLVKARRKFSPVRPRRHGADLGLQFAGKRNARLREGAVAGQFFDHRRLEPHHFAAGGGNCYACFRHLRLDRSNQALSRAVRRAYCGRAWPFHSPVRWLWLPPIASTDEKAASIAAGPVNSVSIAGAGPDDTQPLQHSVEMRGGAKVDIAHAGRLHLAYRRQCRCRFRPLLTGRSRRTCSAKPPSPPSRATSP